MQMPKPSRAHACLPQRPLTARCITTRTIHEAGGPFMAQSRQAHPSPGQWTGELVGDKTFGLAISLLHTLF